MSRETKSAVASTDNNSIKPQTEPKFKLEKLRENCAQIFAVSDSTFAGATDGLAGEFTISEMKNIIKTWLKKEAK